MKHELPITEELDFHYLLSLMPALKEISEYQWLPELFSVIGYEKLILLCKFAGGEIIKIPTLDELSDCIEALQLFYDIEIKHTKTELEIRDDLKEYVSKIQEIYYAECCKE